MLPARCDRPVIVLLAGQSETAAFSFDIRVWKMAAKGKIVARDTSAGNVSSYPVSQCKGYKNRNVYLLHNPHFPRHHKDHFGLLRTLWESNYNLTLSLKGALRTCLLLNFQRLLGTATVALQRSGKFLSMATRLMNCCVIRE